MSCWGGEGYPDRDIKGKCPECDEDVDMDGDALGGCSYSPVSCDTCGYRGCDGSC